MPPQTSLRDAAEQDALCIAALAAQVFAHTYATQGMRPAIAREIGENFSAAAIARLMAQPHLRFVLAERGQHLLGFVQLAHGVRHALAGDVPCAEVQRLYVQAHFNGQGLGSRLMQQAAGQARAVGASRLWLTAWVGNTHARAWYARQGWRDVGATPYEFEGEVFENRVLLLDI